VSTFARHSRRPACGDRRAQELRVAIEAVAEDDAEALEQALDDLREL